MPISANNGAQGSSQREGPSVALRSGVKGPAARSRDELVRVSTLDSEVFTVEQARAHLERNGYLNAGMEATVKTLALSLLQLSGVGKVPKNVSEGMRSVALLLEEVQAEKVVENVTTRVMEQLQPAIGQLLGAAAKVSEVGVGLGEVSTRGAAALEVLEEGTRGLRETLECAVTDLVGKADAYVGQAQVHAQAAATAAPVLGSGSQRVSYAGAVQRPPARHAEALARTHGRERQVLVDLPRGSAPEVVEVLTEKELVAKANAAVGLMGNLLGDRPDGRELFLGAQQLRRGGVLYLMSSVEAASWVRRPAVKVAFMAHYGGLFEMKERGYKLILEYVPVCFDPESDEGLRGVEGLNGLEEGVILAAKYLKDPAHRSPGQATAFVCLTVGTPAAANAIIRDGLVIEGKTVYGRKDIQEPRRCMKCQTYRPHVAANCPSIHDTCARCGSSAHRTSLCQARPDQVRCSNCKVDGHPASDRQCPFFIRESARLLRSRPENGYKFVPVADDPSTWETLGTPGGENGWESGEGQMGMERVPGGTDGWSLVRGRGGFGGGVRGTWFGGARGGPAQGGNPVRGRGRGFVPTTQDHGWNGRARVPAGGSQGQTQPAPGASQGPALRSQSRLDDYFTPTDPRPVLNA